MPNTSTGITYPVSGAHTRLWEHLQTLATTADQAILNKSGHFKMGAQLGTLYNITGAMADIGLSVNVATVVPVSTYLALWTADFQLITAGNFTGVAQLVVDGVAQGSQALWNPANVNAGARATIGQHFTGSVTPGSHTWKIQAGPAAGSTGSGRLNALHTNLSVFVFNV